MTRHKILISSRNSKRLCRARTLKERPQLTCGIDSVAFRGNEKLIIKIGESRLLLHTETPIQSVDNRFLRRLEERREASHALVLDGPLLSSVLLGVLLQEAPGRIRLPILVASAARTHRASAFELRGCVVPMFF